ncbi:MAG TPA: IS1595 family transposase [Gammaproteobacteria bacterium]|nr:IS1595 family transposase [Gammaproteobacteria bacterium]
MKAEAMHLVQWQARFGSEEACAEALEQQRWPNGFQCPKCGHDHGHWLASRKLYQCARCRHQTSVTAGTLFHSSNVSLVKWFLAIYLMACDKGGISALRLSKQIGVSWITAHRMLRKMRHAMADRDSVYRVGGLVELDDALVGGRRPGGKSGRGAEGKTPILVAVESRGPKVGFIAMETTPSVSAKHIRHFARYRLLPRQTTRTDGLAALRVLGETQQHEGRVTPPQQVDEWLPWVHIAIGNLKAYLRGTFHGVSAKYLQEYLDEFVYRFNRRFWEPELPSRLLNACMDHTPVHLLAEKG